MPAVAACRLAIFGVVIAGVVQIFQSCILWGIVLIVIGLLVGPGGVSILH